LKASANRNGEIATKPVKEQRMLRGAASCSYMRAKLPKVLFRKILQRRNLRGVGLLPFYYPHTYLSPKKNEGPIQGNKGCFWKPHISTVT